MNPIEIVEGWVTHWFFSKSRRVQERARRRLAICVTCPSIDVEGNTCAIKGTQPCCKECGCPLKVKSKSSKAKCPKELW